MTAPVSVPVSAAAGPPRTLGRGRTALLVAAIALAPAIATAVLLLADGRRLADWAPPGSTNDETGYWHMIGTFREVGFAGGHYTIEERPAAAPWSRFGIHGPGFPLVYGTLARILGWELSSPPVFHLLVIGACLSIYAGSQRNELATLALTALLLVTYWPLLLLVMTNLPEGMHYGIAVLHALILARAARDEEGASRAFVAAGLAVVLVTGLARITWLVSLPPLLFLMTRGRPTRRVALAAVGTAVGGAAVWLATSRLNAPFRGLFLSESVGDHGAAGLMRHLARRLALNTEAFFLPSGTDLEIAFRLEFLFVVLLILVLALRLDAGERVAQLLVHGCHLGGVLAATLLFYVIGNLGDLRVLSVHLLVSLLFLLATRPRGHRRVVGAVVVANLALAPFALATHRELLDRGFEPGRRARIETFRNELAGGLVYTPGAEPWCNSLTLWYEKPYFYFPELVAVPPGIGLNVVFDLDDDRPRKARYLLMNPTRHARMAPRGRLFLLRATSFGGLFLNLESECDA